MVYAAWPLSAVIQDAYANEVDDFDLPQWSKSGSFAVSAKIPPNTSIDTCRQMLRSLLAERFHLVTAVETREVARYYLKLAKSGTKLKPVDGPPADPNASSTFRVENGRWRVTFRGAPMSVVFNSLKAAATTEARARLFDPRTSDFRIAGVDGVVDETGLTGYYDGAYDFTPLASLHSELAESLEDVLTRQLGLTLELRRAPGKVLVIRSADRTPTEN